MRESPAERARTLSLDARSRAPGSHCGGADIAAIIRLYGCAADRIGTTLRAFPLHGQLYPGVPSLEENYRQPITVLDRVRQLEREEGFQPD